MAVDFQERRIGRDRRRTPGPEIVRVPRAQLVDHHIDDQVDWAQVADAAQRIVDFARYRQNRAWKRVQSWDGPPDAA